MCGRFALFSLVDDILQEFGVEQSSLPAYQPHFNIAPTQTSVVVTNRDGQLRLEQMRWGLIPSWAKDVSIGARLINARGETLGEKPSFRGALRSRRCLVVADGFFEWRKSGGSKTPYFIRLKSNRPFGMAGLFDEWSSPTGNRLETFSIVTTAANDLVARIHDRMPVILPEAVRHFWLDHRQTDTEHLMSLLGPYPGPEMTMFPVSRKVNTPANDGPEIVQPADHLHLQECS